MKDALGKDLRLGQRVAIPCNSRFKIGVLYNYKENRGKYYLQAVEYVERQEAGTPNQEDLDHTWRSRYWNREYVDNNSHKYYIQFEGNKKRQTTRADGIIGVADDAEITV